MADATGHMDRPGAGPASENLAVDGELTGYYVHPNTQTGKVEIVKGMPAGTPDAVVKDFPDHGSARDWFGGEWRARHLR